jgi:hypothetical protein
MIAMDINAEIRELVDMWWWNGYRWGFLHGYLVFAIYIFWTKALPKLIAILKTRKGEYDGGKGN